MWVLRLGLRSCHLKKEGRKLGLELRVKSRENYSRVDFARNQAILRIAVGLNRVVALDVVIITTELGTVTNGVIRFLGKLDEAGLL